MNIYDIAKTAGVSTATVSRYINNSGYVGKKTAEKLKEVIDKSGYRMSAVAKSLSMGGRIKLIGLVCYDINDLYYAKCASVLERNLRADGYEIILTCTGKSVEEKQDALNVLLGKNVDALIFIGAVFMDIYEKIAEDAAKKCPCFFINANLSGNNIYSAYCDDCAAVAYATNALIGAGRKNIVYLYFNDTYGTKQKIEGFLSAASGMTAQLSEDFDQASAQFCEFYKDHRPDAVICSSDVLAAAVLDATKKLGIAVPEKLAVIGHNNSLLAKTTSPSMTSIDNGAEELSEITAANILKLFADEKIQNNIRIDYKLTRRESF